MAVTKSELLNGQSDRSGGENLTEEEMLTLEQYERDIDDTITNGFINGERMTVCLPDAWVSDKVRRVLLGKYRNAGWEVEVCKVVSDAHWLEFR